MSTHNIEFYEEISKIVLYHQICTLLTLIKLLLKDVLACMAENIGQAVVVVFHPKDAEKRGKQCKP